MSDLQNIYDRLGELSLGQVRMEESMEAVKGEIARLAEDQGNVVNPKNGALKQIREDLNGRIDRQNRWIAGLFITTLGSIVTALIVCVAKTLVAG